MITIFNRRELVNTFSMEEQAKVRSALASKNIDYKIKTVNRRSPSSFANGIRSRTGSFGENQMLQYEYIIYVKKSDYDEACFAIK